MPETDYPALHAQLRALTEGVDSAITNLANASALLFYGMEDLNWAGFYLFDGARLLLGPFQGKPACTLIPMGKGVCGTAAARMETQLVDNVHDFPGHIACDAASASEIVVPLKKGGTLWGVLDLDSPTVGRFTERDRAGLEKFSRILEETL